MVVQNEACFKRSPHDILRATFILMKICGLWNPFHNPFLRIIYVAYTIFIMFTIITIWLGVICLLLFTSDNNRETILENSFLLITLLNGWVKGIILLCRHQDIKSLLNVLLEDQCIPQDINELEIQRKFDEEARCVKCSKLVSNIFFINKSS